MNASAEWVVAERNGFLTIWLDSEVSNAPIGSQNLERFSSLSDAESFVIRVGRHIREEHVRALTCQKCGHFSELKDEFCHC